MLVDNGFKKGGEESDQRKADHTNGDVGGLDASIEKHPVEAQQHAYPTHLHHVLQPITFQLLFDEKKQCHQHSGPGHTVPHKHSGVQLNEPTQYTCEPCDKHRQVQQEKTFLFVVSFQNPLWSLGQSLELFFGFFHLFAEGRTRL